MTIASRDRVMGLDAVTRNNAGEEVVPRNPADWADWVSASRTRNWVIDDPLLDWLRLHGSARGFQRDDELPGFDERCDFTRFVMRQGRRFEDVVVAHLAERSRVVTIAANGVEDILDLAKAVETFEAMHEGVPVIHQGVLRDPEHRVYGAPDLLVRSDLLREILPGCVDGDDLATPAPGLDRPWHYRIIDVKFTTLHLLAKGGLANLGSAPAYKIQLFLYARALARQGVECPASYLLGRGWEQSRNGKKARGSNALACLGPFSVDGKLSNGGEPATVADQACAWIRAVRREGAGWSVMTEPSRPELRPNMGNPQDGPWHAAKRRIATELEDPTLLWQVGTFCRDAALSRGVSSWRDPACTPDLLGIASAHRPTLEKILAINRSSEGAPFLPDRVRAGEEEWRPERPLEFYVDFETVNDLSDDFSRFPDKGVPPLIFLVGCGHREAGEWRFARFLSDTLTEDGEARVIDGWLEHMEAVRRRLDPAGSPAVIHWSHAETSTFETAYNSACERHPERAWTSPHWFDLLKHVFRAEPVVVRGAFGFGLKEIAKALHGHGFIETLWEDSSLDGLGAMTGAWWCYEEAGRKGLPVEDLDLMREIVRYNEIDCRVLMDVVRFLRERC
jgi:predicted RecB family nuclease